MQANQYEIYAQFLLDCRKVMGTLDLEKLAYDEEYKAEFFNRISLSADDKLFEIANLVKHELDSEH